MKTKSFSHIHSDMSPTVDFAAESHHHQIRIGSVFFRSAVFIWIALVAFLLLPTSARAERYLIGADNDVDGSIHLINPQTGAFTETVPLEDIFTNAFFSDISPACITAHTMAKHPVSGLIYATDKESTMLFTIDPANASTQFVANLTGLDGGYRISSLDFGPGDVLYAMLGSDFDGFDPANMGSQSGRFCTVDTTTGHVTFTANSGAGSSGHAIAYNTDEAKFYHFYSTGSQGGGTDGIEKTSFGVPEYVFPSGDVPYAAINGVVYAGGGVFYGYDKQNKKLFSITSAGVVTELGTINRDVRGLEFHGGKIVALEESQLVQYDPATLVETLVGTAKGCYNIYALATSQAQFTDPNSYAIEAIFDGSPFRSQSDLGSILGGGGIGGQFEAVNDNGPTTVVNGISSIAYADNVLAFNGPPIFGVLGPMGPFGGGTVVKLEFVGGGGPGGPGAIDYRFVDAGFATTKGNGESSIEYNPEDELLYHFYGSPASLETIDAITGTVTPVGALTGPVLPQAIIGLSYFEDGKFYATDDARNLFLISSAGEATLVGQTAKTIRALQFLKFPTYRPDGWIGTKRSRQKGNNIYNLFAAGQTAKLKMKGNRTGKLFFTIENDGDSDDSISVRATKGNRKLKVKYLQTPGGNVTGAIIRGEHVLNTMGPGGIVAHRAKIKGTRKSQGKRAGRTLRVIATSQSDTSLLDVMRAEVKKKP